MEGRGRLGRMTRQWVCTDGVNGQWTEGGMWGWMSVYGLLLCLCSTCCSSCSRLIAGCSSGVAGILAGNGVRPVGGLLCLSEETTGGGGVYGKHLRCLHRNRLQVDACVSTVALHRDEEEIALEVAGVQPGERQSVSVASLRGLGAVARRRRGCRVHVVEESLEDRPRDAAASVADLDTQILRALHDVHLDIRRIVVDAVELERGAHRILEQLEHDVVEVRGHGDNVDRLTLVDHVVHLQLHHRRRQVVAVAQELCILKGVQDDTLYVTRRVDAANVSRTLRQDVAEHDEVLVLQHSNRDSIDVEAIEEVLDAPLGRDIDSVRLSQLDESLCHRLDDVRVTLQNHLQLVVEPVHLVLRRGHVLKLDEVLERLAVPARHHLRAGHLEQLGRQQRDLLHYVSQSNEQLLAQKLEGRGGRAVSAKVEVLLDGEGGGLELRVVIQLLRHSTHEGPERPARR
ncbi:hypothetical protein PFISCL1PPCAC_12529, partial [Pristionchus fissidentatus]